MVEKKAESAAVKPKAVKKAKAVKAVKDVKEAKVVKEAKTVKEVKDGKAKKQTHSLLIVHITDRVTDAPPVQEALSKFGDVIKTRIGLHEVGEEFSSPQGVLVLDIFGEAKAKQLQSAMSKISGVETKLVVFTH